MANRTPANLVLILPAQSSIEGTLRLVSLFDLWRSRFPSSSVHIFARCVHVCVCVCVRSSSDNTKVRFPRFSSMQRRVDEGAPSNATKNVVVAFIWAPAAALDPAGRTEGAATNSCRRGRAQRTRDGARLSFLLKQFLRTLKHRLSFRISEFLGWTVEFQSM